MKYDIIGDIHGCAKSLVSLLLKLGYKQNKDAIYQLEGHQVIFLGDFIDRGPYQREVINIVRPMVDSGSALSVMGNHEYNAIAYATTDKNNNDYLRKHSVKNDKQHIAFLDAYPFNSLDYHNTIEWFKTLPLWLELDELRVVHACWDNNLISKLDSITENQLINSELIETSSNSKLWQFEAIETILKGKEIRLPKKQSFKDKDGNVRHNIRVRWWDQTAKTYRAAFMGPESAKPNIPNDQIKGDNLVEYADNLKPVFLGHYWMEGDLKPLTSNIACLDYSIAAAKKDSRLVAYRFNGESKLSSENYVWVSRQET